MKGESWAIAGGFVKKVEGFALCGSARDRFLKPESGKVRCNSGAVPQL